MEYRVRTSEDFQQVTNDMHRRSFPFRVQVLSGDDRTGAQNRTLHKWFGEIAKQTGDSAAGVKGQCHHLYGVPIRSRDAQWRFMWDAVRAKIEGMTLPEGRTGYEVECAALASGNLKVSSGMTTKELSEYMDAMARDYREQGVILTDPEARQ